MAEAYTKEDIINVQIEGMDAYDCERPIAAVPYRPTDRPRRDAWISGWTFASMMGAWEKRKASRQ